MNNQYAVRGTLHPEEWVSAQLELTYESEPPYPPLGFFADQAKCNSNERSVPLEA